MKNSIATIATIALTTCAAVATLGFASSASAQEVTQLPTGKNHAVGLSTGLDSAMIARLGYSYRLRPSFWDHDVLLQSAFTMPIATPDFADSRLETGLRTTAVAYKNLRLQLGLGALLLNTSNVAFSANGLGVAATLLPGYQSEHWGLMAELGYEKMFATHLRPSDLYLERGYAGAKSGWYADTAGNFRLGLRGGARLGAVEINARLGVTATEQGTPLLPPFYGTLGAAFAF
jgi:hypothetical protein